MLLIIHDDALPSADTVRQKYKPTTDFHVMYEDLPTCDFKSLFLLANGECNKHPLMCVYVCV